MPVRSLSMSRASRPPDLAAESPPAVEQPAFDLSRERLVSAAITIVGRDGLGALSMRRLAQEVDRSPMAAYRHFDDKQDVLDATVDAIVSAIPLPHPGERPWDEHLEQVVVDTHRCLSRTPGLADLVQGRVVAHPAVAELFETFSRLVQESGADRDTATAAATALVWHIRGAARRDEQQHPAGAAIRGARGETDETLRRATGQGPDPMNSETMLRTTTRLIATGLKHS